jgi:Uma2 family endonuclease
MNDEQGTQPASDIVLDQEVESGYELIDGQLVEKPMGMESSIVGATTLRLLGVHVAAQSLGRVIDSDCGYQIFPGRPRQVRKPDGSFMARGRLPGDKPVRGNVTIAPDLAFEVVSPNDLAEEVNAKVVEFLGAGIRLLWVIYPQSRTLHVFRQGGGAALLSAADELSGEDVVPGFRCRVADLFSDL